MASGDSEGNAQVEKRIVSPELYIKHPLQNRWAMWFFKNDLRQWRIQEFLRGGSQPGRVRMDWYSNLKRITAFDTVEDFWGLYNHMTKASKLPRGCDYSLFKDGIQPTWEDVNNINGGRWLLKLNQNQRQDVDNFWLDTLLCLIGEAFDDLTDDVCGATIQIRSKGDKLGLWTKDARRGDVTLNIGKKFKERLKIPANIAIGFQVHLEVVKSVYIDMAPDRYIV